MMNSLVRNEIVLMAAVHKNEGFELSENDAKLVMGYMGVDDRSLMCDGETLELSVRDARNGMKNATVRKVGIREVVETAIEVCGNLVEYLITAKNEEERLASMRDYRKDLKKLTALAATCGVAQ